MTPDTCGSHRFIEESIRRYETTLEGIRADNVNHQLAVAKVLAEISEQLKAVGKIEGTLVEHNRRRDDDKGSCEEHRADMWLEINKIRTRQDKKDGTMIVIASICAGIGAASSWLIAWFQKQ